MKTLFAISLMEILTNTGCRFHDDLSFAYAKAHIFDYGRICQDVYNASVSLSPKNYDLALLFAALADRTRLRLLNLMDGKEVCVCYFVEILGQSQPKISRHLAYLRRAGIVAARREGKWMHYKIVVPKHPGAARILCETLSVLSEDKTMQAELSKLSKACCEPQKLVALQGAPLPIAL